MASLRDMLNDEVTDAQRAATFAAHGRSMTGLSGKHTEHDGMFGDRAEPIVGERISRMAPAPVAETFSLEALIKGDPVFAQRRIEPANRQPFGAMDQTLAWEPRPNYRRYWFSDQPGRVLRAKRAGYEHVADPDTREPVARITDRADGRGRASYLMETPIEWYQADMARQAEQLGKRLDDIRYGRAGPGAEDNRYVPERGIRITGR